MQYLNAKQFLYLNYVLYSYMQVSIVNSFKTVKNPLNRAFSSKTFIQQPLKTFQKITNTLKMRSKKDGNVFNERSLAPVYKPKTENQISYVNYLTDQKNKIILGVGDAGTGKTLFACIQAMKEFNSGAIERIVLTRPIVPVEEEELGFLPGDIIQKMSPWTLPIMDIFSEFYSKQDLEAMVRSGIIEISPLAYMRGRTFKRCFIIADEMQNSSPNQMMMLLTRIGDRSRMVITGDLKQTDKGVENGLKDFLQKIKISEELEKMNTNTTEITSTNSDNIRVIEFNRHDVERSPIVSKILDIYSKTNALPAKNQWNNNIFGLNEKENSDCALIPKKHNDIVKRQIRDIGEL